MLLNVFYPLIFRFGLSYTVPGSIIVSNISTILVICHPLLAYLIGNQRKGIFFNGITALLGIKMCLNAFPSDYLLLLRVISLSVVPEVDVKILISRTSIHGFVVVCHFEGRGAWYNPIEVIGVTLMFSWLGLHEI